MKESMPDNIRYYVQSTESENGVISARLAHDRMKAIEKACPGLTEEIEGFASEINTDPEKMIFYSFLENCRNVEDAVAYIRETSIVANCNFMVVDATGKAAVIECASFATDKRMLAVIYPRFGLLVSTNHYVAESMREFDLNHMWNSEVRYSSIWKELLINAGRLDENGMKKILAKGYPNDPCCHYYSTGMGTVRSLVFNTTQKKVDVCFGATNQNSWTSIDFDYPAGITVFQVPFENEIPEQEELFWQV